MIGVDQFLGSAAYGTASLLLGTLNQTLWAIWAVMLKDSGSMIAILTRVSSGTGRRRRG